MIGSFHVNYANMNDSSLNCERCTQHMKNFRLCIAHKRLTFTNPVETLILTTYDDDSKVAKCAMQFINRQFNKLLGILFYCFCMRPDAISMWFHRCRLHSHISFTLNAWYIVCWCLSSIDLYWCVQCKLNGWGATTFWTAGDGRRPFHTQQSQVNDKIYRIPLFIVWSTICSVLIR